MMMRKLFPAAVAIAAFAVPSSAMAAAGSTTCANATVDNDAGVTYYLPATVATNLNVPAGAICRLYGNEVQGNISVGAGGTLHTFGLTADRNVTATGGYFLDNNYGFTIKGNLSIDGSQGNPYITNNGFASDYTPSVIMGNFSYTNNLGWFYARGSNTVNGNFIYSGNGRPYQGGLTVLGNSNIS
jgi:hypothetical protein